MKTSVRFLSMLLAVLMIASAALTASAKSADATANSEALQLLVDLGIFGGYDDGSLQPDKLVERDEMAKIIFVLYTTFTDAGEGVVSFNDVAADNWAAGYISWCSSKGIVGGYGNGNFGPDDNVTYDQALKMVCGALGYTEWDSKFWPTDVRTKALTELGLGKNLTDVKGSDFVTRAQIAQIVYNALTAKMNENKSVVQLFPGTDIPISLPVAKTLAVDTWKFAEINAVVTATSDFGLYEVEEGDDDEAFVRLDWTNADKEAVNAEFELAELGLESYKDNLDDLFMSNVRIIYDSKKEKIDADSIIATSVTLTSKEDVTVVYDEKKDAVLVDGEKVDEDYDALYRLTAKNGIVSKTAFAVDDVPAKDSYYKTIAYDFDANGEYDAIYWAYLGAYEVTAVNNDKVTVALYGEEDTTTYSEGEYVSSAALEKKDVVVAVDIYGKFNVLSKVAPVEAAATKYNEEKVTLADVGAVEINKVVFQLNNPVYGKVTDDVMTINEKGETEKSTYYIYDGKVFGHEGLKIDTGFNLAILAYINEPSKEEFNDETKEYSTEYTAAVVIDGKQQTVNVDPAKVIDEWNFYDNKDEILNKFGKQFTEDGKYLNGCYELVSYTVDEDGYYSFSSDIVVDTNDPENDVVTYPAGSTLKVNEDTGLYSIYNGDTALSDRVKLSAATVIYYTYTKDNTGDHIYLGSLTKETLPEKFGSVVSKSDIFAKYDEETRFSEVTLMIIDKDDIQEIEEAKDDYKTDAREIYYCTAASGQALASNGKDVEITYNFKNIYTGEAKSFVDPKGKTPATQAHYYAWDEEEQDYVEVKATQSFSKFNIDDVDNGCLFTVEDEFANGIKIAEDAVIWGIVRNSYTAQRTYTPDSLAEMVRLVKAFNKANGTDYTLPVVVGTHINEKGKKVINTLIVKPYDIEDGELKVDEKNNLLYNTASAGYAYVNAYTAPATAE